MLKHAHQKCQQTRRLVHHIDIKILAHEVARPIDAIDDVYAHSVFLLAFFPNYLILFSTGFR